MNKFMYKFERINMAAIPLIHKAIVTLAFIFGIIAMTLAIVRAYHGH